MTASKRTHKIEKLARIYDDEILPVWSQRFGRMLLRGLTFPERGQILDVACGTGYPAIEIVRRMGPGCRLIAIDAASAMLDVARKKIADMPAAKAKVFFRTESATPRLSFAAGVYDLVLSNLGLSEMADPSAALADFARVTKLGGEVRCTLALEGTFQEFFDIYREVLIKHDKHEALERLEQHLTIAYPSIDRVDEWMAVGGFSDWEVRSEEFSMLFRSSREFFFAPVIELGPLGEWKAIAGKGQEMQDVFWYIKEAIDAYFAGRAFQLTVKAGLIVGRVGPPVADEDRTGKMPRLEEQEDSPMAAGSGPIDTGTAELGSADLGSIDFPDAEPDPGAHRAHDLGSIDFPDAEPDSGAHRAHDLGSADLEFRHTDPDNADVDADDVMMGAAPATPARGTEEIDLAELEELEAQTLDGVEPVAEEEEPPIEAFIDGARRPPHLDDE
ncbi:MAG TPA: class I SAM-dependent methyltransferase [Kofleriaceae bacterium]|nr:class I SAM-dependent methyltransferase [Kofleriaceae bacterium]